MKLGIAVLTLAYVFSQFFRAFLAVLVAPLAADLGIEPEALATASGLWFLTFAAMQIPVGWALDTIGPKRTAAGLFFIGAAGGSVLFASATTALHINIAMVLIGIGCSPVLMASYYIFAREFPPKQFATLAATLIGVGTLGNVSASVPLNWAVELFGWRASLWLLAAICAIIAAGIFWCVKDPAKVNVESRGSLLDLLRMPALWLIGLMAFVSYAPAAVIRGLWISPYLNDVFGLSQAQIGQAALAMSVAMILGVILYGPLDRIFGGQKWVVFGGNALALAAVLSLAMLPSNSATTAIVLMCAVGLFGASFPIVIAHARSLFPPHLTGRGVTLMNLFGMGGVALMQFGSGKLHRAYAPVSPTAPYTAIFSFLALAILLGLAVYVFSRDTND